MTIFIILISVVLIIVSIVSAWCINEHANKETSLDIIAIEETKVLSPHPVKLPMHF